MTPSFKRQSKGGMSPGGGTEGVEQAGPGIRPQAPLGWQPPVQPAQ